MEIAKKDQYNSEVYYMLRIWNKQEWTSYDEYEPTVEHKKKGIFKEIHFTMPNKFEYAFLLDYDNYNLWRRIKPKFARD